MSRLEPTNEASAMQKEISAIAEQGGGTTKVEQLIQQYCPDGVEFVEIGQIAQVGTGSSNGNEADEDGAFPFFVRSQTVKRKNDYEYDEEAIIIPGEGGIGDIFHYIKGKYALHQRVYRIHFTTSYINTKFAFYYMKSAFKQFILMKAVSATVVSIRKPMIEGFPIPVPPLPVQEEIVRILDTFTELQAELQAELQKRLQQYEYYRDKLLSFSDLSDWGGREVSVEWKKLGECIKSLNTGLNPRQFFKLNTDDATNYYITIREMQNHTIVVNGGTDMMNDEALRLCNNRSNLEKGDVLFSGTGTIGEVAALEETPTNWNIKEGVYAIKPNPNILNYRFLMYILQSSSIRQAYLKKAAGGTVKSVPMGEMRKLEIPVPSLAEQQRIVDILDRFDKLTNDITAGLPAEIEARRKQYEYYRDRLLTFQMK